MAKTSVDLELVAQFEKATKSVDNFAKATQKQLSGISMAAAITGINQGFELLEKTVGRVAGAIEGFMGNAIDEAVQGEQATKKLALQMAQVGDFSDQAAKDFKKLADDISAATGVQDDAVLSAAALAKSYNLTNSEATSLTKAAIDLSAVTGDDLQTSTEVLAKTYSGVLSKELKARIPELKALTQAQLANGDAVEAVAKRYLGTAAALSNTYSGAIAKASRAQENFLESLGQTVTQNPVVIEAVNVVAETFRELGKTIDDNKSQIGAFIGEMVKGLASALPTILQTFKVIDEVVSTTVLAFTTLGRSIGAMAAALVEVGKFNFQGAKDIEAMVSADNAKTFADNKKRIEATYDTLIAAATKASAKIQAIEVKDAKQTNAELAKLSGSLTETQIKQKRLAALQAVKDAEAAAQKEKELRSKIENDIAEARKLVTEKNLDKIQQIELKYAGLTKSVQDGIGKHLIDAQSAALLLADLRLAKEKEIALAAKEAADEQRKRVESAASDPGKFLVGAASGNKVSGQEAAAASGGILADALKGSDGASKAISGIIGAAADAIIPGIGSVVSEIVGELAKGPEHVKEMIQGFIKAIPDIIENILLSLPVLIEELAKAIPEIITRLADKAPEIIEALAYAMPKVATALALQMPNIALALAKGIISNIPNMIYFFTQGLFQAAGEFVKKLLDFINPGGVLYSSGNDGGLFGHGGVLGTGLFGATGGVVPNDAKYTGDRYPTDMGPRERLMDDGLNGKFEQWLDFQMAGGGSSGGPSTLVVNLMVGEQQLAQSILNLNRKGFRTS